jgi:hypothetical protein
MALNQTIFSPLTNIQGSISSFTSPLGGVLQIISSSLPAYQSTGWQYKILTNPFTTTSNAQQNITGLQLTLANNKKYIINGYLFGSTSNTTTGVRVGVSTTNTETFYAIENATTSTAIVYGFNTTSLPTSSPSTNLTDYYLVQLKAIAITAASGVTTFIPTIGSEINGSTVAMGPSVIYYREY